MIVIGCREKSSITFGCGKTIETKERQDAKPLLCSIYAYPPPLQIRFIGYIGGQRISKNV
jgi:hypothetical protein